MPTNHSSLFNSFTINFNFTFFLITFGFGFSVKVSVVLSTENFLAGLLWFVSFFLLLPSPELKLDH